MTAVDVDALDKLREALRGNLWAHQAEPWDDGPVARQRSEEELAEILLPVVDRIANERAAAELEAAAEDVESTHTALNALGAGVTRLNDLLDVENRLRSTAAALRASNGDEP